MGDDDDTGGNQELLSSGSPIGKGSKNKRKYLSEFLPDKIDTSSLTEFPRYELLEEKHQNISIDVELPEGSDTAYEEQGVDKSNKEEWAERIVHELLALLCDSLLRVFMVAIQEIVKNGYTKEIAEQTFLRCGLYHSTKDTISNAVEGALIFLRRQEELGTSGCDVFSDFDKLVKYTIVEMVSVLKEVRPGITVAEALWTLVICDLNLLHACVVNRDHLGSFSVEEMFEEGSVDTVPSQLKPEASDAIHPALNSVHFSKSVPEASDAIHPALNSVHFSKSVALIGQSFDCEDLTVGAPTQLLKSEDSHFHEVAMTEKESSVPVSESVGKSTVTGKEHIQNAIQGSAMEEESEGCRKGSSGSSKRDVFLQKAFSFEKNYRGRPKGSFKAKVGWGSMGLEKPLKLPSGSSSIVMKSTLSKITPSVGANFPLPEGNYNVSNISKSVPQATDKAGIPYDESLGKYIPQDDKEEGLLRLASHLEALQKEIQGWNEWANEKVMQATRRLSKDQVELKLLKQRKEEAEKFKKDKQSSEENTLQRLSEMEHALRNATNQIEMANLAIRSLENENSVLQIEVEAAKKRAYGASDNLEEALLREQEALKKSQAMDKLKVFLHEELTTLRQRAADLRHQLERAEDRKNQLEALCRQEEREKQKCLVQAEDIRKETEKRKAKTKTMEDCMRETAERNSQKGIQEIKKLRNEVSQLRLESESSKIAALLGGVDVNYGGSLVPRKAASDRQEFQVPKASKRLAVFQDNFGEGSIKPERECVMCLTEEISVVFFPCAHQVLCGECNVLHEKQGMNDCPSCRTPIQKRIYVRYEDKKHS